MAFCPIRLQAFACFDEDFNSVVSNEKAHFKASEIIILYTRNIFYLDLPHAAQQYLDTWPWSRFGGRAVARRSFLLCRNNAAVAEYQQHQF
jgi:hypothetical protein